MKRELEKSLKRYLKRKVRITLGFVTAFAIMGNVGLASEAIEGSLDWSMEKAKEWTEGYDGSNKIKEITGDRVSISEAGEIKLDGTVLVTVPQTNISNKVLTNINNTADLLDKHINGNTELVIGKDADGNEIVGYNEGLALQNNGEVVEQDTGFEISGEGNIFVNDGELNKSQKSLEGATIVNKGEITFTGDGGQSIGNNGVGYNYGIISNSGDYGQSVGSNGVGYNYGVIINTNNNSAQSIIGTGYNYGILSGLYGQFISKDTTTNTSGIGYNYGIINVNTNASGQYIGKDKGGKVYNYGIINNNGGTAINISSGEASNYGVVKNTTGAVFNGKVDNYGIVIYTTDNQNGSLGAGINKGVVLAKDYTLVSGKNNHVTDLSSTGSITTAILNEEEKTTYYTKDNTVNFDKDLTGKVLTAVITGDDIAYNFNALEPSYSFETEYKLGADTEIKGAVIFDTSASTVTEDSVGHINIRVKEADELGLGDYAAIYDTVIKNLSENDALRNAINYQDGGQFQNMIKNTDFQAFAFYTTGYAVTKDVTDMYMDTVESFGRKAGAGEWLAFGKYLSSDTEFDGGSSSRGYDGDITGTVGMVEYGVNDTTSYGVVFGKGDTEIDITGGGKLDGDNTYIGGYVKHTTEGGIELLGNIGFTKSDLDAKFSTHDTVGGVNYNIISDGSSDADAITLSLKAKKPYSISETLRVEPMLGARYTLINQDAVESSDRNFRIDERDVTVLEGMAGADLVKDFSVANGKLSLKTGVEVSLLSVSDSDDARYTLYGNEIALVNEEEIADSKVSAHVGFGYEHENGVGVDARYKFIWTDKGDSNRAEVGLSYRF